MAAAVAATRLPCQVWRLHLQWQQQLQVLAEARVEQHLAMPCHAAGARAIFQIGLPSSFGAGKTKQVVQLVEKLLRVLLLLLVALATAP